MNGMEYAIEAKRLRQARRTTDPRFTWLHADGTYECKGCGKQSANGGSYGFHVRACTALDVHDVALLDAPTPPVRPHISMTLEIDPDAWTLNYGVAGRAAIVEDVQNYVHNLVTEHLREMGVTR